MFSFLLARGSPLSFSQAATLGHLLPLLSVSLKTLIFRLSPQPACPCFHTHNLFSIPFLQNSFSGMGDPFNDLLCHCLLGFITAFSGPIFSWNVLFLAFLKWGPLDSLPDFPTCSSLPPKLSPLRPTLSFLEVGGPPDLSFTFSSLSLF